MRCQEWKNCEFNIHFSLIIYQTIYKIVDLWGSVSDPGYDGDSLQTIWSSTKNLTALGMAMLVDRGLLSHGDKVTKHWPEFDMGQKGKGEVFIYLYVRGTIWEIGNGMNQDRPGGGEFYS